ncbi:DsbA family oxidoreductase [Heyndrickxia sporothermodurans]|uniref:DsbA family oxidoreductase n=1 Tax=Heyndrickxia sporothermodurans TaxID=46224 RepID=UPI002DBE01BD|nr:DsbA family oxidoreductase [Heyndrickxia sporothermodurans]MEB6549862.1 DsbA family oxidoreductase [Heyndrickxia sporothermodurans]
MKIEIWSDFVCPFCYIGKRRLEMALEQFPERDQVEIAYRSYELDPNASKNNKLNIHEALAKKYGMSIEQAKEANENIGEQAAEIGLTYKFDSMIPTNTFDAHRLAKFAAEKSFGAAMTERLLKAYFTDSKKISDLNTLADLAEEIGLNREETIEMLNGSKYSDAVRDDEDEAKQIGITGVPFFVLNQKYAISGAQPVEAFVNALNMVWEEEQGKTPLKMISPNKAKSEYCTDEGCFVSED